MKTILLASALMLGGTAFAQATQPTDPTTAPAPADSSATTPDQMQQPAPAPTDAPAPGQPDATMPPPPPATSAPGSTMPGSTAPGSTMGTTGSGTMTVQQGGNMTPPPTDTGPYPKCSRTVTDHCVQNQSRERDTKRTHRRPRR